MSRRTVISVAMTAGCVVSPLIGQTRTPSSAPPSKSSAPVTERRTAPTVPFALGETLTYDISWSSYLTAATATLTVKERKPSYGSDAYYIVAEGRPTPLIAKLYDLYYKADTLVDVYSLLPQRASIFSQEGRRQRTKVTTFDRRMRRAQYNVQTATIVKKNVAISKDAQDLLGALYAVRATPLKSGGRFSIPICDGGEAYSAQVRVGPVESVKTGLGEIRAFKLMPELSSVDAAPARRLTLWVSEDHRRLPVRMQAELAMGSFDLTLRSTNR